MDLLQSECGTLPRLGALLDHFELIKDPRQPHWVACPLAELLLLAVCGTIVDCSTRPGEMADWGSAPRRKSPTYAQAPSLFSRTWRHCLCRTRPELRINDDQGDRQRIGLRHLGEIGRLFF